MKGWIYILSNPSFVAGRIKIGMSSNDPIERSKDLYTTGVPEPFEIEYKALVDNYQTVEKDVHRILSKYRHHTSREYFTCSVTEAIAAIKSTAHILFEESDHKAPADIKDVLDDLEKNKLRDKGSLSEKEWLSLDKSEQGEWELVVSDSIPPFKGYYRDHCKKRKFPRQEYNSKTKRSQQERMIKAKQLHLAAEEAMRIQTLEKYESVRKATNRLHSLDPHERGAKGSRSIRSRVNTTSSDKDPTS